MANKSGVKAKKALDIPGLFRQLISLPTLTRAQFLPQTAAALPTTSSSSSSSSSSAPPPRSALPPPPPVWVTTQLKDIGLDESRSFQQTYTWSENSNDKKGSYVPLGYPTQLDSMVTFPSPSRRLSVAIRPKKNGNGDKNGGTVAYVIDIIDTDPSSHTHSRVLFSLNTGAAHGRIMMGGPFGNISWNKEEDAIVYCAEPKPEERKAAKFFPSPEEEEKQAASGGSSSVIKGTENEAREEWGEAAVGVVAPRPFIVRFDRAEGTIKVHTVKGIPEDVSIGQPIFAGFKESEYASQKKEVAPLFDEGLYLTVYANNQGGGRKLGIYAYNTRESKVCYLSARWIRDPKVEEEKKKDKERQEKNEKEAAELARKQTGGAELTPAEEQSLKEREAAKKRAEAAREKKMNRLIVLTPNDHSAQNPRLDGYDPPQLLYTTTDPSWAHISCSSLKTFVTLPSSLKRFMSLVVEPEYPEVAEGDEAAAEADTKPRVYESNTHEMVPIIHKPATIDSFPGLWPPALTLPPMDRFVFDEKHVLLETTWRSQNVILMCSSEDDSLSRLPLPLDAPIGASMRLMDCNQADGRILIQVSNLATPGALYLGEVQILQQGENVAIGEDFLPIYTVHKDDGAEDGEEQSAVEVDPDSEHEDLTYAQVRYSKILSEAQPLHPEAARRLSECEMEIIQVPVPDEERYPDGSKQLPFEAVLLTPKIDRSRGEAGLPPLLAFPHGGPHSVSLTLFASQAAFYAAVGFSVLFINYRGSTGFGQAALETLPGKCGTQDVQDCIRAVELVASRTGAQQVCSRNNLHIQGGSHGGFLTTHLIGQAPTLFQTAVSRNPVCNIAHMIGTSDIVDWCWYEAIGTPYDPKHMPTAEGYHKMFVASPIAHIAKVQTPLLMCVGGADRRVPMSQALDYVKLLKARGVQTRTLLYPTGQHPLAESVSMEGDVWCSMLQWALKRADNNDLSLLGEQEAVEKKEETKA